MPLKAGQVICNGKYKILKLIGEGTFARVWLAQELDSRGQVLRLVAIKELKREALSDSQLAEQESRFQREIRLSARLLDADAPNIVRALTTETLALDDGTVVPLLVMEYMPGGNLADLIAAHPNGMAFERAVSIALDICAALHVVHRLGIVHRDVKPSNILFRSADGPARLADFGTAQLPGDTISGSRTLGTAGHHPGSPDYMPREQLSGRDYLHSNADIFALGCVLFEMATGQCYKRQDPGTLPSQLRPETPRWLDEAVAKALQEDPQQRWQSAGEFKAALETGLRRGDTVPSPEERIRRRPFPALKSAFAVIGLVIIGLAIAIISSLKPGPWPTQITGTPLSSTASIAPTGTVAEASPTAVAPAATATLSATPVLVAMTEPPTPTRTPTATPRPLTSTPTRASQPARTPTPTRTARAAPALVSPGPGQEFAGGDLPVLHWTDTGPLRQDEFYVAVIYRQYGLAIWPDYQCSKEPSVSVPLYVLYGATSDQFEWEVATVRMVDHGGTPFGKCQEAELQGIEIAPRSERRTFFWHHPGEEEGGGGSGGSRTPTPECISCP